MATTVSFKQPCPSCEHPVPIRDPKLIGRKIDCPKCKYRFVVEEPPEQAGDEEEANGKKESTAVTTKKKGGDSAVTPKKANGKAAPAKKPMRRRDEDDDEIDDSAPKKKKGGMSPILILGIGLGAVAVIGLIVTLVLLLRDDDGPSTKGGGGTPVANVDQPKPPDQKDEGAGKAPAAADGGDLVGLTQNVPNNTEIVRDAFLDKLVASDLGDAAFERRNTQSNSFSKEAFAAKWGFPVDNIARHIQAQSIKEDWIFNVIRTKTPIDFEKLKGTLGLKKGPHSPIGDKEYFTVTAELDAFSRFWFSDLYMFTEPTRNKPMGLYKSDEQTIILAELDPLEKFLRNKPEVAKPPEAPPAGNNPNPPGMPTPPGGGMRGGPGVTPPGSGQPPTSSGMRGGAPGAAPPGSVQPPTSGGMRGGAPGAAAPGTVEPPASGGMNGGAPGTAPPSGLQPPSGGSTPPSGGAGGRGGSGPPSGMMGGPGGGMMGGPGGGMMGMGGGQPAAPSAAWLTLKPELKQMLDRLQEPKPAILSVAMLGDAFLAGLNKSPENLGVDLSKVPEDAKKGAKAVGAAIHTAKVDRMTLTLGIEAPKEEDAKQAESQLNLLLPILTLAIEGQYGVKITPTSGQQGGMMGMMGGNMMGMMGGMPPGGMRGPPAGMNGIPNMPRPPGAGGGFPQPGNMGGGAPAVPPPFPPGGAGGFPPGGAGGFPPGGAGGFPPNGGMMGGFPGQPGGNGQPQEPTSTIGISREAALLLLDLDVAWNDKLRGEIIDVLREGLMLARATTEMAGNRPRVHQLAAALHTYTEKHHAFPRGAYDRETNAQRFNQPWPPDQRISWMAEVLRYLPQYVDEFGNNPDPGAYPLGIQRNTGWNEGPNLVASRMLVPQFLAQNSPDDLWRVHYPKVTFPVGATHFVGLSGIGLDAAEKDTPLNRRGVFSYDHPTNLAEITDGADKTIAVVQVPPNFKTPWLAGGGSTVRGLQEKDSIRPFVCAEYQGKKGTYAIMANGDVRFVTEDIPDSLFQALVTIAGNEPVKKEELDKYAPLVPAPEGVELKVTEPPPGGVKTPPIVAPKPPVGGDAADRAKKANDLKQIGLAYHSYFSTTSKAPTRVEDLEPYYEKNAKITAALKDGTYVFYYNVKLTDMVKGSSNTILGYEKDAPKKGGEVLFGDGSVKTLTADEFAKTAKAGK